MDGLGRVCPGSLRCVPGQSPSSFPLWFELVKSILIMQSQSITYHVLEVMFTSMIRGDEAAVLK